MSIIGIDIGSSTTKIIEYLDEKIKSKKIVRKRYSKSDLEDFIKENNIDNIEKLVFTGIGADKINESDYDVKISKVAEFDAIAKGGLYLSGKEEAIIVSVGTGTALLEARKGSTKHLGGTGLGAGTIYNICDRMLGVSGFDEICKAAENGDITKIDLRIGDITEEDIPTLPKELTLSNFGKFKKDASKEDIVTGIVNMTFEVIGMMVAFYIINSDIKEAVLIGNITALPGVKDILDKIENTHKVKFFIPEDAEFAVTLGAIKCSEEND